MKSKTSNGTEEKVKRQPKGVRTHTRRLKQEKRRETILVIPKKKKIINP